MLKSGDIIDGMYQVMQEIGKGGTGVIYLGYHLRLQKQIVIKRIKDHYTDSLNVRGEADILKRLHHMYLPQVYDFLTVGQSVYTVMDYIPGCDLQYYLDQRAKFNEEMVMRWLRQLCEVLDYLHTQKPRILHSDIKPGNIMITPEGNVCLIDFNISLDGTEGKQLQGLSAYYAAPEQYQCAAEIRSTGHSSLDLDERMDLYSLGAVFYTILTGYYPNPKSGRPCPAEMTDTAYSTGLKKIIDKATEYERDRRFKTAREMLRALNCMEKLDPQYRRIERLQIIAGLSYGVCAAAALLLIYGGVKLWQQDAWQQSYTELYKAVTAGDEAAVAATGTDMLNDFVTKGYARDHPEDKAEVLLAVGESYFRQEEYDSAAGYFRDALDTDPENTIYLRKYLSALARSGQIFESRDIQTQYPQADLSDAEQSYIEAESAYARGDYREAEEKSRDAFLLSADIDLTVAVSNLRSDIFADQEDYASAYEALREAEGFTEDRNYMRKAGQMAFQAGSLASVETVRRSYYERALFVYEQLCAQEAPSFEDQLNRAIVLRALGKYKTSLDRLKEMQSSYPDDYRIRMWMCYNYLDEAAGGKVSGELSFCYNSCRHSYDQQNKEDPDMEALIEIMSERE